MSSSMHYYINAAICNIIDGNQNIDYAGIAKTRNDGSYNSLVEYYIDTCLNLVASTQGSGVVVSEGSVVKSLMQTLNDNNIGPYLIKYYADI